MKFRVGCPPHRMSSAAELEPDLILEPPMIQTQPSTPTLLVVSPTTVGRQWTVSHGHFSCGFRGHSSPEKMVAQLSLCVSES